MVGLPVKYSDFYGQAIPNDPISLISDIPKNELIATIAAVNTRLKPIISSHFDTSIETQRDCIRAIFNYEESFEQRIGLINIRYNQFTKNDILFTRVGCLYAFQDILSKDSFVKNPPQYYSINQRENILKFLLICNEKSIVFDKQFNHNDANTLGEDFFDYFMFKQLPYNQYYLPFHPLNKFYIGWYLFDKLHSDDLLGDHIINYLETNYGVDDIIEFFKYIFGQYFQSNDDNFKVAYLRIGSEHQQAINILKQLSIDHNIHIPNESDPLILDFLQLKKSPVYWNGNVDANGIHLFFILDGILFMEKIYSLFFNDFWFDYLKPKKICNRTDWGDFIGSKFFESHINDILKRSYINNNRVTYLESENLYVNIPGQGRVEFADFYLRDRNEVLLVEAKSQYMPNIGGFKSVNTLQDFQNVDRDDFYKRFGMDQLIHKVVRHFNDIKDQLPDPDLQKKGKPHIYPALILNEPIISLGFANFAFRRRFERLLHQNNIPIETEYYRIMPLSILNIMELMDIEETLKERKQTLFNLLRVQMSNTSKRRAQNSFDLAKPFSWVVNSWIPQKCRVSIEILNFKWLGFDRKVKRKEKCSKN